MAVTPLGSGSSAPARSDQPSNPAPAQRTLSPVQRQNLAVLEAGQRVSLAAGNQPLALTYAAAIEAINETLAPALGADALQRTRQEALDVSPQATAERILSLSTGLLARFQAQHPELTQPEQVEGFLELIGSGIERGFEEARDILQGLGVLEGRIADDVDSTYRLVQQGLEAFRERMLGEA
ncbi:DUF5610 domain-containing protein [Motiliproteus sp. SC1-56]|uniref:DUF5610 domain-containing protein n=1 Tax=Motiliproteus sp. SC1-56 TaxID=2799565 RepID=UPI001A8EDEBE|nr:DUF5610 domain-containing protein [Motiliproteus sp. SC1-56]